MERVERAKSVIGYRKYISHFFACVLIAACLGHVVPAGARAMDAVIENFTADFSQNESARGSTIPEVKKAEEGMLWESNHDYLRYWKTEQYELLSRNEKIELFQKFLYLEGMYLEIPEVKLIVEEYENEEKKGYFNRDCREISISEALLTAPREQVMKVLLHEIHHAHAWERVNDIHWVFIGEEKAKEQYPQEYAWKQAFNTYVQPEEDYDAYYLNPVEQSARKYAALWIGNYLWYIDFKIP